MGQTVRLKVSVRSEVSLTEGVSQTEGDFVQLNFPRIDEKRG